MSELYGDLAFQIDIEKLNLPTTGYFPNRLGGQISKPDDTKPMYAVSEGSFLYVKEQSGQSVGKLLATPDGDVQPFAGASGVNHVYVRLIFGAPLRSPVPYSAGGPAPNAVFSITAPRDYE